MSAIPPIGSGVAPIAATTPARAAEQPVFDVAKGLQNVADLQTSADQLGLQVATGDIQDLHSFMAASAKSSLALELTVAVRDKAVEAYQEIMRMQV